MPEVLATREGRTGHQTATAWRINADVYFVALPSHAALHLWVKVTNPAVTDNGVPRSCYAVVLDVGPWNEDDDAYVFGGARPQAESGVDKRGRQTNKAGIDLGERVWRELGMTDNGPVVWEFAGVSLRAAQAARP